MIGLKITPLLNSPRIVYTHAAAQGSVRYPMNSHKTEGKSTFQFLAAVWPGFFGVISSLPWVRGSH